MSNKAAAAQCDVVAKGTVEYDKPDAGALLVEANNTLELAQGISITSPAMYELAAEQLAEIKSAIKTHTERRLGITRKFDDLKKDVMSLFTPALTKLEEAKSFLESGMLAYNAEQRRIQQAEQKRLDDIARAERERLEAEARRVEEEAAKAMKEAKGKQAKAEAEAAVQRAQEEADALRQTSAVVVSASATTEAPKASGTSTRSTWKGRCDNKLALIQFIASHPEHIGLVEVDATALNALARSQKANMNVGGCVAFEDFGITSRRV